MNQENLRRGLMTAAAQLPGLELEEEDLNGILAISKFMGCRRRIDWI